MSTQTKHARTTNGYVREDGTRLIRVNIFLTKDERRWLRKASEDASMSVTSYVKCALGLPGEDIDESDARPIRARRRKTLLEQVADAKADVGRYKDEISRVARQLDTRNRALDLARRDRDDAQSELATLRERLAEITEIAQV